MDSFWKVKEAPLTGLTGMGGGVASLMWAGAAGGSGELYTWGANWNGIRGTNNAYPAGKALSPSPVGSDTNWKTVYGCKNALVTAVKWDGTAWMWGTNNEGRLGLSMSEPTQLSSPTQLGTGTDWKFTGVWETGGWGLKTDGTLWNWGANYNGNLGLNSFSSNVQYSSPVQVPGTTWASCRKGNDAVTLAVKTDGTMWVWGQGTSGRLGLSNNDKQSSPTQLPGTWAQGNNQICAGDTGCLAIKADGTLWSWGYHSDGCLGMNEGPSSWSSPRQVGTDTNWRSVNMSTGSRQSSATKTDGTLWSWGGNTYGGLGINTAKKSPSNKQQRSSPTQVGTDTTWGSRSYNMSLKGLHAYSKTDGSLWMIGGLSENHGIGGWGVDGPSMRSSPVLIKSGNFYQATVTQLTGAAISGKYVEE